MAFSTPIDICNRACQHLGVPQIRTLQDTSVQAVELSFAYSKVKRAELRRNIWTFATRRAVLRAMTSTTRVIVPPTWSSTVTYLAGQIVQFTNSITGVTEWWISNIPNNLNNPPTAAGIASVAWVPYYGPLAVDQWNVSQPVNFNQPITAGVNASPLFFVPGSYDAGELAYIAPGDGNAFVYCSLISNNTDDPWVVDIWNSGQFYAPGQLVSLTIGGTMYQSLTDLNYGNDPSIVTNSAPWSNVTAYTTGQYTTASSNQIYIALQNTTGNNPLTSPTFWAPVTTSSTGVTGLSMWGGTWATINVNVPTATSENWNYMASTVAPVFEPWPIGSGPSNDTSTMNAFMLPYGFLREAPISPKVDFAPWLGAVIGNYPTDYVFEGGFLVSQSVSPITLRYVADVAAVPSFDDMFCEGLAARLALETWERITNKTGNLTMVNGVYKQAMGEARTVNAIEQGPINEELDLYLACRW